MGAHGRCLLFVFLAGLVASPAVAQTSIAVRGGLTSGPVQGFGGVQLESQGLAPHLDLTFRPGVDVEAGSGATLVVGHMSFVFSVPFSATWTGYFGGGPSVDVVSSGGTSVTATVEGLVGFRNARGLFFEVAASRVPVPSLRLAVGFRLR
jgi:hypothetical protein